ncbi:MAG TPA: phospholipid carrier-dependent glycosyltransferase [Candidatus Acidoferrales bacterium]|nr:phospholipid carrier-dependent glycosyltransferase [Candidatus Acidoferrales bacterium]
MGEKLTLSRRNICAALLAAAVSAVCLFSGLSAIGLVGPDEPRYAWIARNMAHSGNWITPFLYGLPWFEKPILYYWSAGFFFKFLHSPEWAARLPSSLAALVSALAMAGLALRRYGTATAWAVLLIFPTCVGVIAFARAASPDMLFTASLALALFCAASVVEKHGVFAADSAPRMVVPDDRLPLIFLGIWLGFATLAKGPAAVVLAGGSVVLWALATRHWKAAFRLLHPLAILFFCVVALPWYIVCAYFNPDFFRTFILLHNFERYLTPVFQHRQPFWFFVPIILLGLLPWTALLVSAALDGRRIFRNGEWRTSSGFFIACWAVFPFIFFSFSQSKLPGYILPIFPPLALLMARSFVCAIEWAPRKTQWLGVTTGMMWVALGVGGAIGFHRLPPYGPLDQLGINHLALAALLIGVGAGIAIEFISLVRKPWLALAVSAIIAAVVIEIATVRVLPQLDSLISARPLTGDIQNILPPNEQVFAVGEINRNCDYGLRFYLTRDTIRQFHPDEAAGYVVLSNGGDMILNDLGVIHRKIVAKFLPYCWVESIHQPDVQRLTPTAPAVPRARGVAEKN